MSLTPAAAGTNLATLTGTDSASNTGTITVTGFAAAGAKQQNITFGSLGTQTVGTTLTLTATSDSGLPVAFTSTTPSICTVSGSTATFLAPGTCSIDASQSGDDSYAAATPVTQSFMVQFAAPVAVNQTVATNLNTVANITIAATGDGTMTYTVLSQPAHGTLTGSAPNLTYTPKKDYWGADSFTFKENNGVDGTVGTVSINVLPPAPVAANQTLTVDYSRPIAIKLTSTGNGTMTYSIVQGPKGKGTITQTSAGDTSTWTYTNDPSTDPYMTKPPDAVDQDSFTFKVNNGHDSNVATVSITVRPAVLQVALASGQSSQAISAGGSASYNLLVQGYMSYSSHSTPPVALVCGGVPNWAICTVTPNQVTLDDKMTPVPFNVTIKTNTSAGTAAASTSMPASWPGTPWIPACGLATFVLILVTTNRAKMQWRYGASAALLLVMSFTGCGTKNTNTGANMVTTSFRHLHRDRDRDRHTRPVRRASLGLENNRTSSAHAEG